jgi:hypothetical protein
VIRVDAAWFAVEPLDMRAGVDTALGRAVNVFGEARARRLRSFGTFGVTLPASVSIVRS